MLACVSYAQLPPYGDVKVDVTESNYDDYEPAEEEQQPDFFKDYEDFEENEFEED